MVTLDEESIAKSLVPRLLLACLLGLKYISVKLDVAHRGFQLCLTNEIIAVPKSWSHFSFSGLDGLRPLSTSLQSFGHNAAKCWMHALCSN